MIDNDLRRRRERSYFCLVAIYVIHAILLNVFAKPQLDVESSVRLSASYLQNSSHKFDSLGRNSSESIIINTVNAVKIVNAVDTGQVNIISSMVNSSSSVEGKKSFEESYDRSAKSSNNDFSQQVKITKYIPRSSDALNAIAYHFQCLIGFSANI